MSFFIPTNHAQESEWLHGPADLLFSAFKEVLFLSECSGAWL
jgi:hypothetical protein